MSGFSNEGPFWNPQDVNAYNQNSYYESDYNKFQNQQLDFRPMDEYSNQSYNEHPQMYNPNLMPKQMETDEFEDEPPLLEELEIYPERILEKMCAVLNPFRSHSMADDAEYLTKEADLAGPLSFLVVLAICLFISGNKAHFGYIYGISVISCVLMYCLLNLMTAESDRFTLTIVASVLGYSILPIVGLSALGVFTSLQGLLGFLLAPLAVFWASMSASKLFVVISGDRDQRPLIAYPSALVAGVYVLLVVF